MNALERFRKTIKVAQYVERNLEVLARIVEESTTRGPVWQGLIKDLKDLFPQDDADQLAQDLTTEQCRVAYLKQQSARSVSNYMNDR